MLSDFDDIDFFFFSESFLRICHEEKGINGAFHRVDLFMTGFYENIRLRHSEEFEIGLHDGERSLEFVGNIVAIGFERTIVLADWRDHHASEIFAQSIDDHESDHASERCKDQEPYMEIYHLRKVSSEKYRECWKFFLVDEIVSFIDLERTLMNIIYSIEQSNLLIIEIEIIILD